MQLIIIRHAKSSWETQENDHNRPLSERGIADANLVFENSAKLIPQEYEIWCSTAKRTKQTAKIFLKFVNSEPNNITYKKELYTFDVSKLERVLATNSSQNIVIFGHNPALTDFVNKFGNLYIENVPTCGVIFLQFEANFATNKKGKIEHFITPKRLK